MAAPRMVVPTPHSANTIGVLNIVFGSLIFLYSLTSLSSLLMAPMFRAPMEAMASSFEDLAKQDHEKVLAGIRELEQAAESEEEREVYRRRLAEVEQAGPLSAPGMELMTMGFTDSTIMRWSWVDSTTSLLANGLMVLAGAGLVSLRSWGRRLGIWVAWAKLARLVIVWGVLWIFVVTPSISQMLGKSVEDMIQQQQAAAGGGGGPMPFSMTSLYAVMYTAWGVIMVVFGAIYPIVCLVVLNRPGVKVACRDPEPTGGAAA